MLDRHSILLEKWRQKEFAHFYWLKSLNINELREWLFEFLRIIYNEILKASKDKESFKRLMLAGHPDILIIGPKEGRENLPYLIEDFEEFFSFLELKPFELKYRFVIIESVHLISETISNKLLKALEEPPHSTSIFFLESVPHQHLETLLGRAIHLTLPGQKKAYIPTKLNDSLKQNLEKFFKDGTHLQDILSSLKAHPEYEQELKEKLLHFECQNPQGSYEQKERTLSYMREAQKSKIFHNSSLESQLLLLEALKFYQEHLAD